MCCWLLIVKLSLKVNTPIASTSEQRELGEREELRIGREKGTPLYRMTGDSPRNNITMNGITGGVQYVVIIGRGYYLLSQFEYVGRCVHSWLRSAK